jgi:hypothetical protein
MKPALQIVAALRDRVGRETLVRGKEVDIQASLNASFLPSKVLILVLAACAVWVVILTGAFLLFTGYGISAGWIFAGAIVAALVCWSGLMVREVRQALEYDEPEDPEMDDCELFLGHEPAVDFRKNQDRMGNRLPFRAMHPVKGERCPGLSYEVRPQRRDRSKSTGPI